MLRDITRLATTRYDLVVVGGGIYGACAAWEGALRGLRVALLEAGDFGGATSGNSLRTLHGGLRHLQRLDLKRMRESIRERREWLRLAPHLARPLRFILPTHGQGMRGPLVMRAALGINDLLSADRNRGVREDRRLPRGAVLSETEARAALAGLELGGCNGAAAWHDAVCLNTERLLLSVVTAATEAGAHVVNYVRATGLLAHRSRIRGLHARDELSGRELEVRTRFVINAAGPWVEDWLPAGAGRPEAPMFRASRAFNLLTRPLPFPDGIGLTVRAFGRDTTYFILPWNDYSLIGTRHLRCDPSTRSSNVMREEVQAFVADLNTVLGHHRLAAGDVHGVFSGLLPEEDHSCGPEVALERDPQVIDHEPAGLRGLVSIVGVKWTIAPAVAAQAVRIACRQLGANDEAGRRPRKLAPMTRAFFAGPRGAAVPLERAILAHLEQCYGAAHRHVLALIAAEPALATRVVADLPVVLAQVAYAARSEMAVRLADVVMRRTPLYLSQLLERPALTACAATLARELRWSTKETGAQVDEALRQLASFRGPLMCDLEPAAA